MLKQLRPALNIGTQYAYLEEKKKERGFWTEDDYEDVYPGVVIGGDGKVKTDPIHIFVPDIMASTMDQMSINSFTCSGIKGYLEMLLPPYTSSDPDFRKTQGVTLLASTGVRFYRHIVDQASTFRHYGNSIFGSLGIENFDFWTLRLLGKHYQCYSGTVWCSVLR